MPRKYMKKPKGWTESDMENALKEAIDGKGSCRGLGFKYGIPESTLRGRRKLAERSGGFQGSGRKPALNRQSEKQLAMCLRALFKLGVAPSRNQIKDMVQDYVRANNLSTPFTRDRPGRDWLKLFLRRNNLKVDRNQNQSDSDAGESHTTNSPITFNFGLTRGSSENNHASSVSANDATPPTSYTMCHCQVCTELGPRPPEVPNYVWKPVWAVEKRNTSSYDISVPAAPSNLIFSCPQLNFSEG